MADAPELEWRADAGGVVGPGAFGVLDLGVRKGAWSAELFTDTLDARWQPRMRRGRSWLGVRAAGYAAGFLPLRWQGGERRPDLDLGAGYAGPDGGFVRYGPHGTYAGASWAARVWWFFTLPTTSRPVPGATAVLTTEGVAGWWQDWGHAEVRAGVDAQPARVSPHVRAEGALCAPGPLSPLLEVRGQWAHATDELTALRLGGTSPYVLPLAGLAVAEHHVEDVVAARAGAVVRDGGVEVSAFVDAAVFDGGRAAGSGASVHLSRGAWFAETSAGVSPWADRPTGAAWGAWVRAGTDWR